MIKEVNEACGKLNETLGISVRLPDPGKKALTRASACNLIAGAGLSVAGAVFASKWCVVFGGIGMISSAVLWEESRCKKDGL